MRPVPRGDHDPADQNGGVDLAAMGGTPRAAVAALVVPPGRSGLAEGVIDGVAAAATACGCPLVGGGTTGGPVVMVSIAVLGTCAQSGPVLRRGAQVGDAVFVTGQLGAAAAALAALRAGRAPAPGAVQHSAGPPRLMCPWRPPEPRFGSFGRSRDDDWWGTLAFRRCVGGHGERRTRRQWTRRQW